MIDVTLSLYYTCSHSQDDHVNALLLLLLLVMCHRSSSEQSACQTDTWRHVWGGNFLLSSKQDGMHAGNVLNFCAHFKWRGYCLQSDQACQLVANGNIRKWRWWTVSIWKLSSWQRWANNQNEQQDKTRQDNHKSNWQTKKTEQTRWCDAKIGWCLFLLALQWSRRRKERKKERKKEKRVQGFHFGSISTPHPSSRERVLFVFSFFFSFFSFFSPSSSLLLLLLLGEFFFIFLFPSLFLFSCFMGRASTCGKCGPHAPATARWNQACTKHDIASQARKREREREKQERDVIQLSI